MNVWTWIVFFVAVFLTWLFRHEIEERIDDDAHYAGPVESFIGLALVITLTIVVSLITFLFFVGLIKEHVWMNRFCACIWPFFLARCHYQIDSTEHQIRMRRSPRNVEGGLDI